MKTILMILLTASISLNAVSSGSASRIIGTVTPALGIKKVAAFNGKDSVFANTSTGTFAMKVHAGNWKLVILALPPYKNVVIENVVVQQDQDTDVGEIRLSQN